MRVVFRWRAPVLEIVTVQAEELALHSRVEWAGVIESRGLNESSGLAPVSGSKMSLVDE